MAVTVTISAPRAGKEEYDDGDAISIDDEGNLVVTAREGRGERVVAAHAAGSWLSARVLPEAL